MQSLTYQNSIKHKYLFYGTAPSNILDFYEKKSNLVICSVSIFFNKR